jgi:hypothetical protein
MRVRIHFTLSDGSEDSLVLTGTIEEIQEKAKAEVSQRMARSPWSEVLEE